MYALAELVSVESSYCLWPVLIANQSFRLILQALLLYIVDRVQQLSSHPDYLLIEIHDSDCRYSVALSLNLNADTLLPKADQQLSIDQLSYLQILLVELTLHKIVVAPIALVQVEVEEPAYDSPLSLRILELLAPADVRLIVLPPGELIHSSYLLEDRHALSQAAMVVGDEQLIVSALLQREYTLGLVGGEPAAHDGLVGEHHKAGPLEAVLVPGRQAVQEILVQHHPLGVEHAPAQRALVHGIAVLEAVQFIGIVHSGIINYQLQESMQAYENEEEQSQQQSGQIDEQLPQYAEVDGRTIKLAGLDYTLLNEEKEKDRVNRTSLLDALKNKINVISGNVVDRSMLADPKYKEATQKIKQDKHINALRRVFAEAKENSTQAQSKKSETFYLFDLDQFGKRKPTILQKRIGKAQNMLKYVHFDEKFRGQLASLMQAKQRTAPEAVNIAEGLGMADDDDDDIFGDDSEGQQSEQKMQTKPKVDIQVGKKLSFGIEQDIFAQKRPRPVELTPPQPNEQQDKYFFMRKKVKTVEEDDGYGECYHQSGPSLQQLVDLKKQGIEYYGDLKQFKQKERKAPNINKEYQMVQKIIEKNSKK